MKTTTQSSTPERAAKVLLSANSLVTPVELRAQLDPESGKESMLKSD